MNQPAFRYLIGQVSLEALNRIQPEWEELKPFVANLHNLINLGPCECEILLRFHLPCKHYLLRAAQTGQAIPRSLIHPRWWLKGPAITLRDWVPIYPEEEPINYLAKDRI